MIGPSLPPNSRPREVPPEIDRWNWGAFWLTCFWGIFNGTPIALLAILPGFNVVMPFVLGARGSRWAWRNRNWDSVEHFKRVQHKWAVWGCVTFLCGVTPVAALIGISFYYPFHVLRHSDAFELATSRLQTSTEAAIRLGTPITIGLPQGAIRAFSGMEEANLHFSVTGPKAKAQAFVRANKIDGPWVLQSLVLRLDGQKDIQLVKRSAAEIDNIARHQAWRVLIDCAEALMANFRSDAEDARNDVRVREHRLWKPASCLPGPLDPRCGAVGQV